MGDNNVTMLQIIIILCCTAIIVLIIIWAVEQVTELDDAAIRKSSNSVASITGSSNVSVQQNGYSIVDEMLRREGLYFKVINDVPCLTNYDHDMYIPLKEITLSSNWRPTDPNYVAPVNPITEMFK